MRVNKPFHPQMADESERIRVVLLKRLRDAEESNDRIHAVDVTSRAIATAPGVGSPYSTPWPRKHCCEMYTGGLGYRQKILRTLKLMERAPKWDPREARAIGAVVADDDRSEPTLPRIRKEYYRPS
ncbi:hypothetical protein AFUB_061450 [Aspergillus fumigatus A1163]|uniref:Uncharacterized protein n=1 Tax=Aspergillus fumigatus (strain CBS 144.89 / FGSC A1163 / CEA10) TaxID=451804 RepID=B0Y267_ASPFC|nr:hypothetical protein AFUB_061450 [Aspergillus fumigatus A1163]